MLEKNIWTQVYVGLTEIFIKNGEPPRSGGATGMAIGHYIHGHSTY